MVAFIRTGRVAGGCLLLSLAACGGRTGELYGNEYSTGSSLPGDDAGTSSGGRGATSGSSSSSGSTSNGGSTGGGTSTGGSTGTAGSTQAGAPSQGGAPGTGGTAGGFGQAGGATAGTGGVTGNPGIACADLCLDPSSPCPDQFGPAKTCANDCLAALSVRNGACAGIGAQLVYCVKDAAQKFGQDCSTGASQAPLVCAGLLNAYQACASGGGPVPPPASCSGSGSAAPGKCFESQTCSDGTYFNVTCYEQGPTQTNCTCNSGTATANITLNESAMYACSDALVACGGSTLPK